MNNGLLIRDHWIDGDTFADPTAERIEVIAGQTGERICDVPEATRTAVAAAVSSARESPWRSLSARDRGRALMRLAEVIEAHRVELAQIESQDTGKPISDADSIDLENCVRWLEYAAGWPKRVEGAQLPVDGDLLLAFTRREPIGVAGLITAWNYPLMLAIWKAAPALAAGCPVVIKPSERAPLACLMLGLLAAKAGLPDGAINVVTGGPAVGQRLVNSEGVDKISFTGSAIAGRAVAAACAARGIPCTTELGGKSAALVLPDASHADLSQSLLSVVEGLAHNAGQACNAPSRLIYPQSRRDEVIPKLAEIVRTADPGTLIDRRACSSVARYVETAASAGAELIGQTDPGAMGAGPHVYPLCAIEVGRDSELWREEVFGPVLAVSSSDPEEFIRDVNDSRYDLAAGVFGEVGEAIAVAKHIEAGHVYVNCWSVQDPCAPFGGMGGSGLGREHGREGLDAYLRTKTVFVA